MPKQPNDILQSMAVIAVQHINSKDAPHTTHDGVRYRGRVNELMHPLWQWTVHRWAVCFIAGNVLTSGWSNNMSTVSHANTVSGAQFGKLVEVLFG
jgi:hypothetical protein